MKPGGWAVGRRVRWRRNINPPYVWAAEVGEGCVPTAAEMALVHEVSRQCRTPMEHLRRWHHPQPSPGPVQSVSSRPSIPSRRAQATCWAVFEDTSIWVREEWEEMGKETTQQKLCNLPERGVKHCRRAAQGRKEDAPPLQSNVLLLAFPLGKPSKQAVMTGGHIPLLDPQTDEHLPCSSQSNESLRPCLSGSARPGPHPVEDQKEDSYGKCR